MEAVIIAGSYFAFAIPSFKCGPSQRRISAQFLCFDEAIIHSYDISIFVTFDQFVFKSHPLWG